MALVLPVLENLGKDKHVESLWFPRLDEGSIPSSSTNNTENQQVVSFTPNFTPRNVELGVFIFI